MSQKVTELGVGTGALRLSIRDRGSKFVACAAVRVDHQRGRQVRVCQVTAGVGAEYSATLCDLGVFMDQPTEPIPSDDLDVGVDRVG
jgi:hypothetical protein